MGLQLNNYTAEEQIDILKNLRKLKALKCEKKYETFFKEAWKIIEPEQKLQWNWHLSYLCNELESQIRRIAAGEPNDYDVLIINVPPATSKSSVVTKILPAFAWTVMPAMKIISASYDASLANDHALKTRDIINSLWYQRNWGDKVTLKRDKNRKSEYENTATGLRIATSVGGGATGKHAHIVIVDDPTNPKKAASEKELKSCNTWWDLTMSSRLVDKKIAIRILVMQRLHEADTTGHILSKKGLRYKHICLPAETYMKEVENFDGTTEMMEIGKVRPKSLKKFYKDGLLDDKRLNRENLATVKVDLGSTGYAGQMMQSPTKEGGNILKRDWFGTYSLRVLQRRVEQYNLDNPRSKKKLIWNFVVDGAFTEKEENDPSGIMAYAIWEGNMYIRNYINVRLELPDLCTAIVDFAHENGYSKSSRIYIEPKASGLPAAQTIKKYTKLNVIVDKAPTTDKVARAKGISAFVEAGRVYVLRNAGWAESFLDSATTFPNAKHDEEVDCLVMSIDKISTDKGKVKAWAST